MLEYSDSEDAANGGITIALQSALEFYNFLMTGDLSEVYQHFGPVFEQHIVVQNNAYNFELNLVDDAKATIDYFTNLNYAQTLETYINSILVELGAETTIVEILDKIAAYGGAGAFVPISGFANAMVSPAMEFRREGLVMGVGAKLFTIAGPVLVWGISISVIVGVVYAIVPW